MSAGMAGMNLGIIRAGITVHITATIVRIITIGGGVVVMAMDIMTGITTDMDIGITVIT